jgi:hypothetical protein
LLVAAVVELNQDLLMLAVVMAVLVAAVQDVLDQLEPPQSVVLDLMLEKLKHLQTTKVDMVDRELAVEAAVQSR